jgi:hypothetical protein
VNELKSCIILEIYVSGAMARGLAYLDKHKGFAIFALKCADMHAMCALAHTFAEVHFSVKEQGINGLSRMAWFLYEYL